MAVAEPETSRSKTPKLRADAFRNREKLVDVATAAFAENGVQTSLEDIARRAGVGIGTLYRHFPTRGHLVETIYRRELESLAGAAEDLANRYAPDVALEEWMHRFVSYIATKRGLAESLKPLMTSNASLFAEGFAAVRSAFDGLVQTAGERGLIRTDIDTADLMQALSSIYSMPDSPDWEDRSYRLIGLLMDGLRARR